MFRNFILGFWVGLPVSAAVGIYGLVMGIQAATQNITWLELMVKSFAVFAGASQIVVVEAWGSPIWLLLIATAAINLRYIMVGLTLRPILNKSPWPLRIIALWYAADENWALTLARRANNLSTGTGFLLGSGMAVLACWQLGGQIGFSIGANLPDPTSLIKAFGFDFAFPAIFLALALSFVKSSIDWLPMLVAACAAIGFSELIPEDTDFQNFYIVGGTLAGCIVSALSFADKLDKTIVEVN